MFKKATKYDSRARVALSGPSGSGKTMTALKLAHGLGSRIAAVDTEHGSMSKYANLFDFDVVEPDSYNPETLIQTIQEAEKAGYEVLIVDSLSHYWMGKDGELEQVDRIAKRSNSQNSFTAWKEVTPLHNRLVDTMLSCKLHLIVTMRTKTEWVLEKNDRGKTEPRKVGIAPVMRDGIEFEFDICGDLNAENELIISKTRCSDLVGGIYKRAGEEVAAIIAAWCKGVTPPPQPLQSPPPPVDVKKREPRQLFAAIKKHGVDEAGLRAYLATRFDKQSTKDLSPDEFDSLLLEIEDGTVKQFLAMPPERTGK